MILLRLSEKASHANADQLPAKLSEYMTAIRRKGGQIGERRRLKIMTRQNVAESFAKSR
jgi:hypothetical protein